MGLVFSDVVTTEEQLRDVIGEAPHRVVAKVVSAIDEHISSFIAKSPFVVVSSSDAAGNVDVSPKGDPPGFVQVLDEHTLAIPDRLGNRRVDTFTNLLQNPKIGLYFVIPGKQETLRISGTAIIVRDAWLLDRMAIKGKAPEHALVVTVEEAMLHCAKCIIRSELWDVSRWPSLDDTPSLARVMIDHGKLDTTVEEMQEIIDASYRDRLY